MDAVWAKQDKSPPFSIILGQELLLINKTVFRKTSVLKYVRTTLSTYKYALGNPCIKMQQIKLLKDSDTVISERFHQLEKVASAANWPPVLSISKMVMA